MKGKARGELLNIRFRWCGVVHVACSEIGSYDCVMSGGKMDYHASQDRLTEFLLILRDA